MTPAPSLAPDPCRAATLPENHRPDRDDEMALEATFALLGRDLGPLHSNSLAAPTFLADYRILREIGRGGMGVVYEAEQTTLGRRVALKVLPPQAALDSQFLERFRREARAAAGLHHTNIVPVFEVGREGSPRDGATWFYAMQFIDGVSLDRAGLDRADVLPAMGLPERYRRVAHLGEQLAGALAYAHERGVIHRDIKPANLLLDRDGVAWVSDFGLAKPAGDDLTQPGDLFGTPLYMAPERFRGSCDRRSDIYGLGLTLYELLLGRPAFDPGDPVEVMHQVQQREPLRPRQLDPHCPRDLETILLKAIDKDPERRYQDAAELAEDLRRFQADEPIRARPIGPLQRLARAARRNPRMAALVVAVCTLSLLLVVGSVLAAVSFRRLAEEERRHARAAQAAQAEAMTQADRAVEQTEALQETSVFLLGLLEETDPLALSGRGFGSNLGSLRLSPVRLLDQAAAKLRTTLHDQPAVRASLLAKIGSVYVSYGRFASAKELLDESLSLRLALHAGDHPDVAESHHLLGFCHLAQCRLDQAEAAYRRALAMRRRLFGENHPLVAETLMYLGIACTSGRTDDEAETLLLRARDIQSRRLGKTSREYAMSVIALVQHYYARKQSAKMLLLLPEADAVLQAVNGAEEPAAAMRLWFQAQVSQRLGFYHQSARLYREALALGEPWLGETHFVVLQARMQHASLLHENLKDYPAAEKEYRLILDRLTRAKRAVSPEAGDVLLHFGRTLRDKGDFAEAEKVLRQAVDVIRSTNGQLARAHHVLGAVLTRLGRWTDAEPVLQDAVRLRQAASQGNNLWYGRTVDGLVTVLRHLKNDDRARAVLEEHLPVLDNQKVRDPHFHFEQACRRARWLQLTRGFPVDAERADAERTRAVASLHQALREGYPDPRDLETDRALAPLRTHPDFPAPAQSPR